VAVRTLSLCSGIGGLDLGVRIALPGAVAVGYVERDAYAASVLVARMEDSSLDPAPLWSDLKTFDGKAYRGSVDLLLAGYPCQPFSLAGARKGTADERHLWPHVARIISECEPGAVFLENVPGHISLGLREVLLDLEGLGYCVEDAEGEPLCEVVSAAEVGATHLRKRLFVLAYRDLAGLRELWRSELLDGERQALGDDADGCGQAMGNAHFAPEDALSATGRSRRAACESNGALGNAERARLEVRRPLAIPGSLPAAWPPGPSDRDGWRRWIDEGGPEPVLRRGADESADRMDDRSDRLRCLGNAVVPLAAAHALRLLATRAFMTSLETLESTCAS
jgi:DNA (cytosine-5)-methyltransferase 1